MKIEHNKKYITIAVYALVIILISMVFNIALNNINSIFDFFKTVFNVLTPFVYGVILAFLLNPILRFYDDKLLARIFKKSRVKRKTKRSIAILLTYITAAILVGTFIAVVLPQLIESISALVKNIPAYMQLVNDIYVNFTHYLRQFSLDSTGGDSPVIAKAIADRASSVMADFFLYLNDIFPKSVGALAIAATTITAGLINSLLGLFISIYLLFDREKLFAQLKKMGHAIFSTKVYQLIYSIFLEINRIFSGFVIGKVIDSIIIGILCMIILSIAQMPFAVFISVMVGVTNFIPYFGPIFGAIPGFIIILLIDPIKSIAYLIIILVLQQVDGNIIGPKILGDALGLSPLWIIIAITLFTGLLGVPGMFIGVPLFALLYSLVNRFIVFLLSKKGISSDTIDYL